MEEARELLARSQQSGLSLRLTGGLAVYLTCPSARHQPLARDYHDIDLVGLSAYSGRLVELFRSLGYLEPGLFNTLNRTRRLRFMEPRTGHDVDIFLDRLIMCHSLFLADRLTLRDETISPADLMLTKLQIVELNRKDVLDIVSLLADQPLTEDEGGLSLPRIREVLSGDWGFWRTVTLNLEHLKVASLGLTEHQRANVEQRAETLLRVAYEMPKTVAWKLRSLVGERLPWYELPEDTG